MKTLGKGWILTHDKYGTWFLPRQAVIEDWKRYMEEFDWDGLAAREPNEDEIETWFTEQTSWIEVKAYGKLLEKPDMNKWFEHFMNQMSHDTDWFNREEIEEIE